MIINRLFVGRFLEIPAYAPANCAGGAETIIKPNLLLPSFSKRTATRPSGRTQASLYPDGPS